MNHRRRCFLKAAGGTLLGASTAGCLWAGPELGSADPSLQRGSHWPIGDVDLENLEVETSIDPDEYTDRFSHYIHLADEGGADPTGQQDATPAIENALANDTLVDFGDGEYKLDSQVRRTGAQNVGLIGQNAVIRHGTVDAIQGHIVTEGEYRGGTMMFRLGTPLRPHQGDLVFGGFIFDWSWSENAGMQGLNTFVDGQAEVRNISFNGVHSLGTHGNLRVATASPESHALVDSVYLGQGVHYRHTINTREPSRNGVSPPSRPPPSWSTTGLTGHPQMEGTLHCNNVHCGIWPDNGIYVQGGDGRKIVTNCVTMNSNIANIRLDEGDAWEPVGYLDGSEGRDSPYGQSTVENCRVVVDHSPDEEWYLSQRGIWFRGGRGAIRECQIIIDDDVGPTYGASSGSAVGVTQAVDQVTIERLSIELHSEGHAIYSTVPGDISVSDVEISTVGWEGDQGSLIRRVNDVDNIQINHV